MDEEQYIHHLFSVAKISEPKSSFQQVKHRFLQDAPKGSSGGKFWMLRNLNIILPLLIATSFALIWMSQRENTAAPMEPQAAPSLSNLSSAVYEDESDQSIVQPDSDNKGLHHYASAEPKKNMTAPTSSDATQGSVTKTAEDIPVFKEGTQISQKEKVERPTNLARSFTPITSKPHPPLSTPRQDTIWREDESRIPQEMEEFSFQISESDPDSSIQHLQEALQTYDQFKGRLSLSRNTDETIRRFILNMRNAANLKIRIRTIGFREFKMKWKVTPQNQLFDLVYRFDDGDFKNLKLDRRQIVNYTPIRE